MVVEYLDSYRSPALARSAVRRDFAALGSQTDTGHLTEEEAGLVDVFVRRLDEAIDSLAAKSDWYRTYALWWFRTPRFIRVLLALSIALGLVAPILVWTSSK